MLKQVMEIYELLDSPTVTGEDVAITTETPVPGCATGASHIIDIEEASRIVLETAKAYGKGL